MQKGTLVLALLKSLLLDSYLQISHGSSHGHSGLTNRGGINTLGNLNSVVTLIGYGSSIPELFLPLLPLVIGLLYQDWEFLQFWEMQVLE